MLLILRLFTWRQLFTFGQTIINGTVIFIFQFLDSIFRMVTHDYNWACSESRSFRLMFRMLDSPSFNSIVTVVQKCVHMNNVLIFYFGNLLVLSANWIKPYWLGVSLKTDQDKLKIKSSLSVPEQLNISFNNFTTLVVPQQVCTDLVHFLRLICMISLFVSIDVTLVDSNASVKGFAEYILELWNTGFL